MLRRRHEKNPWQNNSFEVCGFSEIPGKESSNPSFLQAATDTTRTFENRINPLRLSSPHSAAEVTTLPTAPIPHPLFAERHYPVEIALSRTEVNIGVGEVFLLESEDAAPFR